MAITGAFDFDIDMHGAWVIAARNPLMPGCLSDKEIEANIRMLKDDLDAVARRMKKAAHEQRSKSLLPGL